MNTEACQMRLRMWSCGLLLAILCAAPGHAQEKERKVIKQVEAQYPSILKRRGIGGTVRLRVTVKADGSVKDVEVSGGNAILADSAVEAVKQWKFSPASAETIVNVAVIFDPNK
jgi:periplasmic protein TonB